MVEILYRAALILVSFAVIWLVVKNRMMQKENDFLALHDQMTEQNYRLLRESAELNRHLVHDVKHHLLMLREYVKEGNLAGIAAYLDEIEDEYMYAPRKVWTGNGFLDFILSQKKSRAESKGIVFDIDSEIIPVCGSTYIMDTPGFSTLQSDMEKEALKDYYPEFALYEPGCRFAGCSHIGERDCGVKEALAAGKINGQRYQNYCQIYEELKHIKRY